MSCNIFNSSLYYYIPLLLFIYNMKNNQFFRSEEILANRENAIKKINDLAKNSNLVNDGATFIAKYYFNNKILTLFAIADKKENIINLKFFDSLTINELKNKIENLKKEFNLI